MIQARCGSTRLPNKVLADLCGKTVLSRIIERVQKSKLVDEVMVVTSIDKNNIPIILECAKLGVRVGVGSENDVLDRYYQTARLINPEYVIRLTADCPCFDAELLDMAIESIDPDTDYCGMLTETFADGLDLEIIKLSALRNSWENAVHTYEREHVTQYIIKHPELFKLQNFESPIGYFGNQRWTIDEPEDYEFVVKIYNHFVNVLGTDDFGYKDILDYLNENPELLTINNKFERNEGLKKSIQEDKIISL